MFAVGAIVATLFSVFAPAINNAHAAQNTASPFAALEPLHRSFLAFFALTHLSTAVGICVMIVFGQTSRRVLARFVPTLSSPPVASSGSRQVKNTSFALSALIVGTLSSALLILAVRNIPFARLHPLDPVPFVAVAFCLVGWLLSAFAAILGQHVQLNSTGRPRLWALAAIALAAANCVGSLCFMANLNV